MSTMGASAHAVDRGSPRAADHGAGIRGDDRGRDFRQGDRLELIEGVLVGKMVKGERHSAGVGRSWRAVDRALPAGWHVRVEMPIAVTGRTAGLSPTWPWPGARSTTTCGSAGRPGAGMLCW